MYALGGGSELCNILLGGVGFETVSWAGGKKVANLAWRTLWTVANKTLGSLMG